MAGFLCKDKYKRTTVMMKVSHIYMKGHKLDQNTESLQNSATWSKAHSRSCYLQYVLLRPLQRVGKNCHHLIPDSG